MLILKYFVVIGGLMVAGLMALNAHMAPSGSVATGAVTHASSAASLPIVPPKPAALLQPAVEAARASGGSGAEAGQGRASMRPLLEHPTSGALSPALLPGEPAVSVVWSAAP